MIEVLDIVAIQNDEVLPPKEKYHVCIHEEWFFVINSNARKMYDPHLKIQQLDYTFLRQDSYICCSRIFSFSSPQYRRLGILSPATAKDLIQTVESALTLTPEEKEAIRTSLSRRITQKLVVL